MGRKKGKSKDKISITINNKVLNEMDQYLSDEDLGNRSKYIEKLIREDMSTRGKNTNKF